MKQMYFNDTAAETTQRAIESTKKIDLKHKSNKHIFNRALRTATTVMYTHQIAKSNHVVIDFGSSSSPYHTKSTIMISN